MIIDTHCHFDMMPCPEAYINKVEREGNISIGMTNLPSHFVQGYEIVRNFKHVRLALGFHPLLIADNQREIELFKQQIDKTSYIGEIGLDFSKDGIKTKELQLEYLRELLSVLDGQNKIVSVHSKRAEKDLVQLLYDYHVRNVIFHWYSGDIGLIQEIVKLGYYFSINESMTLSASGKRIIQNIPCDHILTETDAPFNRKCSIKKTLSNIGISEEIINDNFKVLLSRIR